MHEFSRYLKKAEQIIDCAVENGITYFDTADMYDKGINESVVGKALLEKYQQRDDIFIGTKVGNRLTKDGSTTWYPSKSYIKEAVKGSLKRLRYRSYRFISTSWRNH